MGKLILILKLGAFLAGASLSGPRFWFFGPDWYFGVFFGAVIVIWEARSLKDLIGGRSVAFLGVATGIHQGSVFVADRLFGNLPAIPLIDDLIRTAFDDESILVAGLLLSLALPFAHLRIWNARCRPAKIIAPCLFGAWFGICILIFNWRPWDDWVNVLSIWQAIYLACMFSPWPRFLVRRTHVSRATKSPFTSLSTIQVATFLFALAYTPAFNWLVAIWSPLFLISSVIGYVGFRYRIWQAWSLGWVVMPVALFLFVFDWLAWIVPESFDVGSFYDNDYEYLLGRIGFAIIALVLCESAMRTFSSSTRKVRSLSLSKLDSLLTFQLIGYNVVGILTILTFFSMEVLGLLRIICIIVTLTGVIVVHTSRLKHDRAGVFFGLLGPLTIVLICGGSISGVITDASGGVIPGVDVGINGTSITKISGDSGQFVIPWVPLGHYWIWAYPDCVEMQKRAMCTNEEDAKEV